MGAGQIGGIATLLDIDFENAAGFIGEKATPTEAQFIVYYFSHAMMFCTGGLIESHIVLTPARCVHGEKNKFEVYGGSHQFLENTGVTRTVLHISVHRGFNHSTAWTECTTKSLAILVLNQPYSFSQKEIGSSFILSRLRYGTRNPTHVERKRKETCKFFGWGSRRNGYLMPLLIHAQGVEVKLLPVTECADMWNKNEEYLCIEHIPCMSDKYGALCPDDLGSILVCSGFAQGMMVSRLVDRPCGVGFLDLTKFTKFMTCAVDDSRDVINDVDSNIYEFHTTALTTPPTVEVEEEIEEPALTSEEMRI